MKVPEWGRVQWIANQAHNVLNQNPDQLATVPLDELEMADAQLGDFEYNADYRLILRRRISTLKEERDARKSRRSQYVGTGIGFLVGVAVTLIGVLAQHYLSSGG